MFALRLLQLTVVALASFQVVAARDVPRAETSLLTVRMEALFAAVDKYIATKSLADVKTKFSPVKKQIQDALKTETATIDSALTTLFTFQYEVDKTHAGFKAVDRTYLTDAEDDAIAVPARWDAVYAVFKAMCDPLKNAKVDAALAKVDTIQVEATTSVVLPAMLSAPMADFLTEVGDLGLVAFSQTLSPKVVETANAFSDNFKTATTDIKSKLDKGESTVSKSESTNTTLTTGTTKQPATSAAVIPTATKSPPPATTSSAVLMTSSIVAAAIATIALATVA